jgi:hypothetical protein
MRFASPRSPKLRTRLALCEALAADEPVRGQDAESLRSQRSRFTR